MSKRRRHSPIITHIDPKGMILLPPRAEVCQECAKDHPADFPHDAQSLYYQVKFLQQHGRSATWRDAMSHCSDDMRAQWEGHLADMGVDLDDQSCRPKAGAQ